MTELAATFERLFDLLRVLTPEPMSLTTSSVLRRLDRAGNHRLSDLALVENVTQPAMTQLVTRLERDGLATRGGHPDDGRVVVVTITDGGRDLVRRRRRVRSERLSALLGGLAEPDRAAILAALPAIDRLTALDRPATMERTADADR